MSYINGKKVFNVVRTLGSSSGGGGLESRSFDITYYNNEYIRILKIPNNDVINKANVYINIYAYVTDDNDETQKILTSTNSFELSYGKSTNGEIFSNIEVFSDYPSDLIGYGSGSGSGAKMKLSDLNFGGSGSGSGAANDQLKALIIENDNGSIYLNGLFTSIQMEEVYDHSEIEIAIEKISGDIQYLDNLYINNSFTKSNRIQINQGENLNGNYRFEIYGTLKDFSDMLSSENECDISLTPEVEAEEPKYFYVGDRVSERDMPGYYAFTANNQVYNNLDYIYCEDEKPTEQSKFYVKSNNALTLLEMPLVLKESTLFRAFGNRLGYVNNDSFIGRNANIAFISQSPSGFEISKTGLVNNTETQSISLRIKKTQSSPIDDIIYVSKDGGNTIQTLSSLLSEEFDFARYDYFLNETIGKIKVTAPVPWGSSDYQYVRDEANDEEGYFAYKYRKNPADGNTILYLTTSELSENQSYKVYKKNGENDFAEFNLYGYDTAAYSDGVAYKSLNIEEYCEEHNIEYTPLEIGIDEENSYVSIFFTREFENFTVEEFNNGLGEFDISVLAYKNSSAEDIRVLYSTSKTLEYLAEKVSDTTESNGVILTRNYDRINLSDALKLSTGIIGIYLDVEYVKTASYGSVLYGYARVYAFYGENPQKYLLFSYDVETRELKTKELEVTFWKNIIDFNVFENSIVISYYDSSSSGDLFLVIVDKELNTETDLTFALPNNFLYSNVDKVVYIESKHTILCTFITDPTLLMTYDTEDLTQYSTYNLTPSDWSESESIKGRLLDYFEGELYFLLWSSTKLDIYYITDEMQTSKLYTSTDYFPEINPSHVKIGYTGYYANAAIVDNNNNLYIWRFARTNAGSATNYGASPIISCGKLNIQSYYSYNSVYTFSIPKEFFRDGSIVIPVVAFNAEQGGTKLLVRYGNSINYEEVKPLDSTNSGLLCSAPISFYSKCEVMCLKKYKDYFIGYSVFHDYLVEIIRADIVLGNKIQIFGDSFSISNLPLSFFFSTASQTVEVPSSGSSIDFNFTATYYSDTKTFKVE